MFSNFELSRRKSQKSNFSPTLDFWRKNSKLVNIKIFFFEFLKNLKKSSIFEFLRQKTLNPKKNLQSDFSYFEWKILNFGGKIL